MDYDRNFENGTRNCDLLLQSPFYANPYLYVTLYAQNLQALAFEITDLEMW